MLIEKVISGGQTGADQAGLYVAKKFGIETGGFAPKDFMTKEGTNKILLHRGYGLIESTGGYKQRTWENVESSDGTIRLAISFSSPGELCTYNAIKKYNKPWIDINLLNPLPIEEVIEWILLNDIKVLNVAGNTQGTAGHDIFKMSYRYLTEVFKFLSEK